MKEQIKKFFSSFKNNWGMKMISLVFAILLWSFVVSETNPYYNIKIDNVTVKVENYQSLDEKELVLIGGVNGIQNKISATVRVQRSDYSKVNETNVQASVDLSTINSTGEHPLKITVKTQYGEVISSSISEVKVYADERKSKTIPVSYEFVGEQQSGYHYEPPILSSDTIEITGAKSIIETAEKGTVKIDLTDVEHSFKKSMTVSVQNSAGDELAVQNFSSIPSVAVKMEILPKKTVAINVKDAIKGTQAIAAGYEIKSIVLSQDKVDIIGEKALLSSINEMLVEDISLHRQNASFTITCRIKKIEGITIIGADEISVSVNIGKIN